MTQSDGRSTEHIFGTLILEKSGVGADQPSLLAVGMSVVENERCPGTTRVERSTTLFLATALGTAFSSHDSTDGLLFSDRVQQTCLASFQA